MVVRCVLQRLPTALGALLSLLFDSHNWFSFFQFFSFRNNFTKLISKKKENKKKKKKRKRSGITELT